MIHESTPYHDLLNELSAHRDLLEELSPYALSPEEAWRCQVDMDRNPHRALTLACFKAQLALLWCLQREGKLREP